MSVSANELISACEAKDKSSLAKLVSSIPKENWDVIVGRADCLLDPVKIQVWHETGDRESTRTKLFSCN
jgi:hypothetical protein